MNATVHGKASLAELLMADSAAGGKNGDDERDKTNTVDFGATLLNLIDQSASKKDTAVTSSTATGASDESGRKRANAVDTEPVSNAERLDASSANWDVDHFTKEDPQSQFPEVEPTVDDPKSQSPARATRVVSQLSSRVSTAYKNAIVDAGNSGELTDAPNPSQTKPAIKASPDQEETQRSGMTSSGAAISAPDIAAGSVPNQDTVLDFRKETFPLPPTHDATTEKVDPSVPADRAFAKAVNLDHSEAATHPTAPSKTDAADSSQMKTPRVEDGTSSALSNPSRQGSTDSKMNSSATQMSPDRGADTNSTSAQQAFKSDVAAAAEIAPEQERTHSADTRENSTPATPTLNPPADAARADSTAPSRPAAVATIRPATDVTAAQNSSRTVNLTVQLAEGQAAQASLRERAGAVDVKILTPSPASAQRVSSELDAMRQNLSAAGIKLGHAEVSYQQGDGRQQREQYQSPAQQQSSDSNDVFVMDEVTQ
jgi:hypothetical protein